MVKLGKGNGFEISVNDASRGPLSSTKRKAVLRVGDEFFKIRKNVWGSIGVPPKSSVLSDAQRRRSLTWLSPGMWWIMAVSREKAPSRALDGVSGDSHLICVSDETNVDMS